MKIVHVCGWYFPDPHSHCENYVAMLASRLAAAGHQVTIAAPDPAGTAERSYRHEEVSVYRYPVPGKPTVPEAQHATIARGAERLHVWLREMRPDVVHFHAFATGAGPQELRAARAAGARVYATAHTGSLGFLCQRGTMMRWGRELCDGAAAPVKCAACELQHRGTPRPVADLLALVPKPAGRVLRRLPGTVGATLGMSSTIGRQLELQREVLASVDRFVVLNEWARRVTTANDGLAAPILLNRLGTRATASDAERRRAISRPRHDHVTVGYVGRLDHVKGVHDLARAVRRLGHTSPVRVEFRSPVSNLREFQVSNELKAIVGPDAWVQFKPPVEGDALLDFLCEIDVLCCPSLTVVGGSTVAVEAMAVGTPVIATRLGACAELIADGVNGRLVAPGDWRALATAIRDIAREPATLDVWRRALPPVRTMDDVARDYLQMYQG
jgi:glycosyltransferase involved in cell wall biosynthesis